MPTDNLIPQSELNQEADAVTVKLGQFQAQFASISQTESDLFVDYIAWRDTLGPNDVNDANQRMLAAATEAGERFNEEPPHTDDVRSVFKSYLSTKSAAVN